MSMPNSGNFWHDLSNPPVPPQRRGMSSLYPSYPDAACTPGFEEKRLSVFLIHTVEALHSHGLLF